MKTRPSLSPHAQRTAFLLQASLCFVAPLCGAAELGAIARVQSWPTVPFKFTQFNKGSSGIITDSAAEGTLANHASASFHTLAVACSGTGNYRPNPSSAPVSIPEAYWFDQITISSPTVPNGTIGTADFTLFFEGELSTGPSIAGTNTYRAYIGYQWTSGGTTGKPNTAVGTIVTRDITVFSGYTETKGPEFYLGQPINHQLTFRYGEPFDFTMSVTARGMVHSQYPSTFKASLRLKGWNGFNNIRIRDGATTPNAVVGSQTNFNYGEAGSTTYEQWASAFQIGAASGSEDTNKNGIPNLLEYALGRDPRASGGGDLVTPGSVVDQGVSYPTIVFTRPILGARPGDIEYIPERGATFGDGAWSPDGMLIECVPDASQGETVTVRSSVPLNSLESGFMRLKVVKP